MSLLQIAKLICTGLAVSAIGSAVVGMSNISGALINAVSLNPCLLSAETSTLVTLERISNNIVLLFVFFVATLWVARFFFKSSITVDFVIHFISLYFCAFTLYRIFFGLTVHPVVFLLVAFGYFVWGSVKNVQAVGKLAYTFSEGPLFCRKDLYTEMCKFNHSLSKYFLYVTYPLFGKLIWVFFNVYSKALAVGVTINLSMAINYADHFQEVGYLVLAMFNWLCYYMFSLCWSQDLFNLNTNSVLKLVVGLFFAPMLILFQILVLPFMNNFFISFFFYLCIRFWHIICYVAKSSCSTIGIYSKKTKYYVFFS